MIRFLNGNFDGILKDLEEKMQKASEELKFEKAIEYRELLGSVKKIAQKQKSQTAAERTEIFLQQQYKRRMRSFRYFLSGEAA